ncbi:MAG: hypothetical protein KBG28_11640 [Kofleriaceae bacterium]|nr:hypothetical protein [Kofleriaceae bacterium]
MSRRNLKPEPPPLVARTVRAHRAARSSRELARDTMSYLTSTVSVADDAVATAVGGQPGHRLEPLGLDPRARCVYFVEELGDVGAPLVHRMQLTGPCRGVLVPMASWYDAVDPDAARHRLAALAPTLTPLAPIGLAPWVLTTRVLMHRAVQLGAERPPVRKFALELSIAAEGSLASGRAVVTTYLRPRVRIDGAWQVPGHDAAILRVGYVGVPSGVGLGKQTPVLVSPAGPAGR